MDGDDTLYLRLSLMTPRPAMRERVIELHRELVDWLRGQDGFVHGYLLVDGDPQGRIGHLNLYRSEDDADRVAQTDHVLHVRSELLMLIEEESHVEHSYTVIDPPATAPRP